MTSVSGLPDVSEALPGSHHENPLEPLVVGHVQVVDFEVERHPAAERRHAANPDRSFQCRSRCTLTGNDRKCAPLVRAAKIAFTVLIGHCDIFCPNFNLSVQRKLATPSQDRRE